VLPDRLQELLGKTQAVAAVDSMEGLVDSASNAKDYAQTFIDFVSNLPPAREARDYFKILIGFWSVPFC
jgi:hypothetical protein